MAYMFRVYDEGDPPAATPTAEQITSGAFVTENENVSTLRTGATWLLASSTGLCFFALPVGACGVVASLVILAFCPVADKMTDTMSAQIRSGNNRAGGCWFALICIGAVLVSLVALGGGLLTFAEMAGRL